MEHRSKTHSGVLIKRLGPLVANWLGRRCEPFVEKVKHVMNIVKQLNAAAPIACMHLMGVVALIAPASQAMSEENKPEARKALTTAELKSLLSGNSLGGNGKIKDPAKPYDWIAHYGSDGVITLKLKPAWGGGISKGRWWLLDDGQQCRKFETGHGKEGCWRFYREGGSPQFLRFVPSSGVAYEGRAVMIKGDAVE